MFWLQARSSSQLLEAAFRFGHVAAPQALQSDSPLPGKAQCLGTARLSK